MSIFPQGAYGAYGSTGAYGAYGAYGASDENPMLAGAFIGTQDGISSALLDDIKKPIAGIPDDPQNLSRLSANVRAAIYQSNLGPTADVTCEREDGQVKAVLWRRNDGEGSGRSHKFDPIVQLTAPNMDQFKTQMRQVWGYSQIRADRASEILTQVSVPMPFFSTIGFIDPARTPYTIEFLYAALAFASSAYQRMKYTLAVKRPIEFSPQLQPMIPTPTHGALPSGHATEAFLMARLLWKLLRDSEAPQYRDNAYWGEMLMRLAARIATNRTVAGVHYPVDSVAGALLGLTVAEHVYSQCCGGKWWSASFDGTLFDENEDFNWHELYEADGDKMMPFAKSEKGKWMTGQQEGTDAPDAPVSPLSWLYGKALAEWQDFQPTAV